MADQLVRVLVQLGLNTPVKRGLAFAGIAGVALYLLQPAMMFDNGVLREWKLISDSTTATYLPLYVGAGAAGAVGYYFL
jgi:hypothetical protein